MRLPFSKAYLNPLVWELASHVQPPSPLDGRYKEPAIPSPVARHMLRLLRDDGFMARLGSFETYARYAGIEQRMPYLDRRVIEFVLHLPVHLLSWRGARRIILRESMQGILPESVRTRTHKADMSGLGTRGIEKEWDRIADLLKATRLAELGLVDLARLQASLQSYRSAGKRTAFPFRQILHLEDWLRAHSY